MAKTLYESPIGYILLESDEGYVTGLTFAEEKDFMHDAESTKSNEVLNQAKNELNEYFAGERKNFTLKLRYSVSTFREKCYEELLKIPYGETVSYKDIAVRVCNPNAVRAVGGANHNNGISIFIPCHRVIGSNGDLTGYGGGLWRKKWLLEHERKNV